MSKETMFAGTALDKDFPMEKFHKEMQKRRKKKDLTFKSFLGEQFGYNDNGTAIVTPETFYRECGIDLTGMTVGKMLETSELNRYLAPEIFRDAIRKGLEYTPFYSSLVAVEESIQGTALTMPFIDFTDIDRDEVRLRDTNEGATITEGEIVAWSEKQVTIRKRARGLKQTYEMLMFTPIDLAAIYFEELGTQLGADLDRELINIAINGDQPNFSEAAPVIGATTPNTLAYVDLARAWIRFRRIGRNSSVMLTSEADAVTILNMAEFQKTQIPNGVAPSGITLNVNNPLPTSQDIFVHDAIPTGKIILVDRARAFIQLTAMPLLIESEKIISRQVEAEYVSIITGFANIFRDGRLVLDYTTSLTVNPGPGVPTI